MSRIPPTRRRGITLTEVLVALFVMAVGLISLLTLFPLGAIRLAQALRDDRCTQTAGQADAYLRQYWQRAIIEGGGEPALTSSFNNSGAITSGPSSPVLVDPIGWQTYTGTMQTAVAGINPNGFPRQTLAGVTTPMPNANPALTAPQSALRTCTLLDDITFAPNGTPDTSAGATSGQIARGDKYTWAAVLQLTNASQTSGAMATANVTVMVFDGRPPLFNSVDNEKQVTATLTAGSRSVTGVTIPTVADVSAPPLIRKGGWFLDGSVPAAGQPPNNQFYRVVGVTPNATNPTTQVDIDIEPPVVTGNTGASLYFFAGLAEVFQRPPLIDIRQ